MGQRRGDCGRHFGAWMINMTKDPHIARLFTLLRAALNAPRGFGRITSALVLGAVCHLIFALAVGAMIATMFFGMQHSLGRAAWPVMANAALIAQFPLAHSLLLSRKGQTVLAWIYPAPHGKTLISTTYAIIASAQLLALFALWTPSGIIWWQAEGAAYWALCTAYTASWLLLMKASFDAGVEVQSGALGWLSMLARIRPVYPQMPTRGLFAIIRQPIYVAFALTLWTVPVWTPDQLALALTLSAYCLIAPRAKERRFAARYGADFDRYRAAVPYAIPRIWRQR